MILFWSAVCWRHDGGPVPASKVDKTSLSRRRGQPEQQGTHTGAQWIIGNTVARLMHLSPKQSQNKQNSSVVICKHKYFISQRNTFSLKNRLSKNIKVHNNYKYDQSTQLTPGNTHILRVCNMTHQEVSVHLTKNRTLYIFGIIEHIIRLIKLQKYASNYFINAVSLHYFMNIYEI